MAARRTAATALAMVFALAVASCGGDGSDRTGDVKATNEDGPVPGATEPGVKTTTTETTQTATSTEAADGTGGGAASETGQETAGTQSGGANETFEVELEPQGESELSGIAGLRPAENAQQTIVQISLSGGRDLVATALVHEGSCDDLGDPVYTLQNVEDGRSRSRIETSFDQLRVGGYAIALHPSPESVNQTLACGEIVGEGE